VTRSSDDERRGRGRGRSCPECGAARALDQRYCLACGARLGSLPAPIAALVGRVTAAAGGVAAAIGVAAKNDGEKRSDGEDEGREGWPYERSSWMPSPRAAAAAVIGMLALGVAIGSATDELAQSAGLSTILLEAPSPPPEEAPEATSAEPEPEEAGEEAVPAAVPSTIPQEVPLVEEPLPEEPLPEVPEVPEELPAGLPEVKHVFVVMLGENGYEESFGKASHSPFLSEELPAQGELLPNYFAVTSGELANEIALLSGQGPTPETAADCPNYADVIPGTESAEGQVEGNGCLYPATTKMLLGQFAEKDLKWRAYVNGIEAGAAAGQPTSCRHPQLGTPDPNHVENPADPYLTWRNPFVYFHSIVDSPECAEADVGLPLLSTDLKLKAEKFPALAYIAPDEESLPAVIEEIKESLAYKDGGMIAITSAQARPPDTRSCCISPAYPNLPPALEEAATGPVKESGGGGQVGLLLISPFVEPGTTSETYFNHYSLLATIAELFGLEKIGYAAEPAIIGFDESIFNASS
jgi:phosphatidylinositol-3-phosphatase